MKKLYIFIILLSFKLQAQNNRVEYIASTRAYFDLMKKKHKNSSYISNGHDLSEDLSYTLDCTSKESLFYKTKTLEEDKYSFNPTLLKAGEGIYYTNSSSCIANEEYFGKLYLITKNKINWKLHNESRKIGKYTCYKATAKISYKSGKKTLTKEIVAWYTPKIPLSFGPKNYRGLPGLILLLKDGGVIFSVKQIYLNTDKKINIKKPTKGKKISEKEMENELSSTLDKFKAKIKKSKKN